MHNDLAGIIASLIPTPRSHFLLTSYTPFTGVGGVGFALDDVEDTDVAARLAGVDGDHAVLGL
jgi:hypothetical protein